MLCSDSILTLHRDYEQVPKLRKDDNVLPAVSDIPSMLSSFGKPRRRRVSVGPQSEADAREYLANRYRMRSDEKAAASGHQALESTAEHPSYSPSKAPGGREQPGTVDSRSLPTEEPASRSLLSPPVSNNGAISDADKDDEKHDREMFSAIEKPRVRYDAEVITKLVVYAGT